MCFLYGLEIGAFIAIIVAAIALIGAGIFIVLQKLFDGKTLVYFVCVCLFLFLLGGFLIIKDYYYYSKTQTSFFGFCSSTVLEPTSTTTQLTKLPPLSTDTPQLTISTQSPIIEPAFVSLIRTSELSYKHNNKSAGSGIFASVESSDGMAEYKQSDLDFYFKQISMLNGSPNGCGKAGKVSDYIWFSGIAGSSLIINGEKVGTLNQNTGSHGVLAKYSVQEDDELCAINFGTSGYNIIVGPEILYHYDSYCYRGFCS
jgi:hypothetical protein